MNLTNALTDEELRELQGYSECIADVIDELFTLREQNRWIPVTSDLISLPDPVLIFTDKKEMMQGTLRAGSWAVFNGENGLEVGEYCKVTHYRKRPSAPKEGS